MRILQCLGSMNSNQGGPPRVVEGLSLCLANMGHKVSILGGEVTYDGAAFAHEWPKLAAHPNITYLPPTHKWFTRYKMNMFDVTHFHGVWDMHFLTVSRACRAAGVPYVISSHGCLDPWSLTQKHLKKLFGLYFMGYRRFLNNAAGLIYGTQDESEVSGMTHLAPPSLILPNGVGLDADVISTPFSIPDAARPVLTRDVTLLYFSRIHHKKGVHLLVDAFLEIARDHPHVGLCIAGIREDEALEMQIRAQIADCDQIYMSTDITGPNAKVLFNHCNAFLLPTFQEGFSIAVLEALFYKLPVMITPACRLPQVITALAGWECNPTVDAIKKVLIDICQTPKAELMTMGQAGHNFIAGTYTWPAIAQQADAIYTSAIGTA